MILYKNKVPKWLKEGSLYDELYEEDIDEVEIDDKYYSKSPSFSTFSLLTKSLNIIAYWGIDINLYIKDIIYFIENSGNVKSTYYKILSHLYTQENSTFDILEDELKRKYEDNLYEINGNIILYNRINNLYNFNLVFKIFSKSEKTIYSIKNSVENIEKIKKSLNFKNAAKFLLYSRRLDKEFIEYCKFKFDKRKSKEEIEDYEKEKNVDNEYIDASNLLDGVFITKEDCNFQIKLTDFEDKNLFLEYEHYSKSLIFILRQKVTNITFLIDSPSTTLLYNIKNRDKIRLSKDLSNLHEEIIDKINKTF